LSCCLLVPALMSPKEARRLPDGYKSWINSFEISVPMQLTGIHLGIGLTVKKGCLRNPSIVILFFGSISNVFLSKLSAFSLSFLLSYFHG
jgi:hypothetical protein